MTRRHEMTDVQYESISHLLPENGARGGQWVEHLKILNGMFWRLRTGSPWRGVPGRYGPWSTVYDRFRRWARDGTLDRQSHAASGVDPCDHRAPSPALARPRVR